MFNLLNTMQHYFLTCLSAAHTHVPVGVTGIWLMCSLMLL